MYKDKDKQKEADRVRQQRRRDVIKSKGVTKQSVTGQGVTVALHQHPDDFDLIKKASEIFNVPTGLKRGKDIKCFADLPPDVQQTIDRMSVFNGKIDRAIKINRTAIAINYQHLFPDRYELRSLPSHCQMTESECEGYKPASELKPGEYNHVSKPSDADYNGVCTSEWRAERGR